MVLDFGSCISDSTDVPLEPLCSSTRTKTFEKIPLTVQTDGSKEKGMMMMGFIIYDGNGSELVCQGNVNYGLTSNDTELCAIL